jgi:hypothetical protein
VSSTPARAGNCEPSLHPEPGPPHRFDKGRPRLQAAPYTWGRPSLSTGTSMGEVSDSARRAIIANVEI